MAFQLGDRQQQTVAVAVTTLGVAVIIGALGAVAWMVGAFLDRFSSVFLPIAVGAIGALVVQPYYAWLTGRLRLPPVLGLAAVFLSVLIPVTAFFFFFGAILVSQLVDLVAQVPEWWEQGRAWVESRLPEITARIESSGWGARLRAALEGSESTVVQGLEAVGLQFLEVGRGVARGITGLLGWLIAPVYFAFFLVRGVSIDPDHVMPFLKKSTREDIAYLLRQFIDMLVAFFRGQLLVAFIQGVLYSIGFALVGLKYGFVLGMLCGLLNIVPYLGSMIGLAAVVPLSLLQPEGGLLLCALALAVFSAVQAIEGWFLTPRIMGSQTGLHPMVVIIAIFFWGSALNGIMGMVLAIPLTAFLASVWRLIRDKYVAELF